MDGLWKGTHEAGDSFCLRGRNEAPEEGRRRKMHFAVYVSFGPLNFCSMHMYDL